MVAVVRLNLHRERRQELHWGPVFWSLLVHRRYHTEVEIQHLFLVLQLLVGLNFQLKFKLYVMFGHFNVTYIDLVPYYATVAIAESAKP